MSSLTEGSRLGRYRILRRLGAGSMGEVYLAEDPQIGRRLAIKTVRVEEGRPREVEERKQRLLREARAAGRLLHPHVVTLFDAGEDQDVFYLAFEWVEGSDLEHRLAEGPPLSLAEALSIVRQAAQGLDAAHRQGVVHRDIKPSNLMLTVDGRVKVADFGIAKVVDSTSDLTMTGSVVGSPHYLSPEQVRGEELDGRTDIFSLGVMLYELLSLRRPFEGETLTTLVYQILHRTPPSIAVRRPDLGPRLVRLVELMMHKNRERRIATAGEVVAEIEACERELLPAALGGAAAPSEITVLLPPEPETEAQPESETPPAPPAPRSAVTAATRPVDPAGRSRWIGLGFAAVVVLALIVAAGLGSRRWAAARSSAAPAREAVASGELAPSAPAAQHPAEAVEARSEAASPPRFAPGERERTPPAASPASTLAPPPPTTTTAAPAPLAASATPPAPSLPMSSTATPLPPARPLTASSTATTTPPAPVPALAAVAVEERAPSSQAPAPAPDADSAPAAAVEVSPPSAPAVDPKALREAFIERVPVAREMQTAMTLSFDVQPKEVAERIVVRLDRIVLGRATDWNAARRGGRAYAVPEPGLHILSFHADGAEVYRIRIEAQADRSGPTTITVSLPGQARRLRRRPGN